jgi:hypothetical protein
MSKLITYAALVVLTLAALGACGPNQAADPCASRIPLAVDIIPPESIQKPEQAQKAPIVAQGQSMNFVAAAEPSGVTFAWVVTGSGTLTNENEQIVRYSAPASVAAPEDVTLTVTITEQTTGCMERKTFTWQLVPNTAAAAPTAQPTLAATEASTEQPTLVATAASSATAPTATAVSSATAPSPPPTTGPATTAPTTAPATAAPPAKAAPTVPPTTAPATAVPPAKAAPTALPSTAVPPATAAPTALPQPTALPSATAAPTALPPPTAVLPAATQSTIPPLLDVFAQAIDGEDWSWSHAPGLLTNQFVADENCRLSGQSGLRLAYSFTGAGNGGWGVHWANTPTKHFNAAGFTALTFSVRGTAPNGFQIGLKDTTGFEVKVESNAFGLASDTEWRTITIPLTRFARQGQQVNIAAVENVNFGFHSGHGAGNICIDEIAFQLGLPSPLSDVVSMAQQTTGIEAFRWQSQPGALDQRFAETDDCRPSGMYGLQLIYGFSGTGNGGWGVHWANTAAQHFDASGFTALTFSVRGTAPNGFQIGLKDTTGFEVKVELNEFGLASDTEWRTITVPLTRFARQGQQVNTAAVENVNFGFHSGHGSGSICLDEITFVH